jgi:Glycosyl hydrolase family 26
MRSLRLAIAAAAVAVITACSGQPLAESPGGQDAPPAQPVVAATPVVSATATMTVPPGPMVGVYEGDAPSSYSGITKFTQATGVQPRVVLYYSGWNDPFQEKFAATAYGHGATTFVQLEPAGPTLASIAEGDSDPYLREFADQVREFGHPVLLSFAHEMNGNWYSWGVGNATPAQFIAAWRHVVQVFRGQGADNVTWVWTVNAVNPDSAPLRQWWPGSQWVNWVGVDGYFYFPSDTFASVFGTTLTEVRAFTDDPVFIGETAVGPGSETTSQVTGLFAGVKSDHVAGLVWFDQAQDDPPYHLDWHLANDPAALAAFRAAARRYDKA